MIQSSAVSFADANPSNGTDAVEEGSHQKSSLLLFGCFCGRLPVCRVITDGYLACVLWCFLVGCRHRRRAALAT